MGEKKLVVKVECHTKMCSTSNYLRFFVASISYDLAMCHADAEFRQKKLGE